jgi:hypothetical protein
VTLRTGPSRVGFDKDGEITGSGYGLGPFELGGDRSGSARVHPVLIGTLVVDISDTRTGALVWRTLASSDFRPTDNTETRDKKIARAMDKMFRNYPPKSR